VTLETLSANKCHGGVQGVYKHASAETGTEMIFSVFLPPQAEAPGANLPVVWYLSGLTCTHANVTEKGEYRRICAELGLIFVAPDTSPRGEEVPDDPAGAYDFGLGAGFYVDATQQPYARHYRMYSYIAKELPELIAANFPARSPSRLPIRGATARFPPSRRSRRRCAAPGGKRRWRDILARIARLGAPMTPRH
jgi:S-formylglutathione hydrolase